MSKEFNYKYENTEINRIANEVIGLLNEYNLKNSTIKEVLKTVTYQLQHTEANAKLKIEEIESRKCKPVFNNL